MPIYCYHCTKCAGRYESMRAIADREKAECAHCGAPSRYQEIELQPVRGTMAQGPELVSEAQLPSDWRETPGSRRMANDEPERLYSLSGDVTRRHTKRPRKKRKK